MPGTRPGPNAGTRIPNDCRGLLVGGKTPRRWHALPAMASLVQLGGEPDLEGSQGMGSPSLPWQQVYYLYRVGYLHWKAVLFNLASGHGGGPPRSF